MDAVRLEILGLELRNADDDGPGTVTGPVVNYGDVAKTRRGMERIRARAFLGLHDENLACNLCHRYGDNVLVHNGQGLTLTDTPTALLADTVLPKSPAGLATANGVRSGALRGYSSEFVPVFEERAADGVIDVHKGLLTGLGIVDKPAYAQSLVQLRQIEQIAPDQSVLISGPAGAGKTQFAQELQQRHGGMVSDFQSEYAKRLGIERDPVTGRYPPRRPEDRYIISIVQEDRRTAVAQARARGQNVYYTNSLGENGRRRALLQSLGERAIEEVIDPGELAVAARLSVEGVLSGQCREAIDRWYRPFATGPFGFRSRMLAWL